jgi:iron complex transport system permease protein
MTACAVAISGPIGFVGLICPHMARWFCGNDNRRLLPVATAIGAAMLVLADALARTLLGQVETIIPVGVITSLIGGPFFLVILLRMRRA